MPYAACAPGRRSASSQAPHATNCRSVCSPAEAPITAQGMAIERLRGTAPQALSFPAWSRSSQRPIRRSGIPAGLEFRAGVRHALACPPMPTLPEAPLTADILTALHFAALKHRDQRRKDAGASPYINHPIEVAELLARIGGVTDPPCSWRRCCTTRWRTRRPRLTGGGAVRRGGAGHGRRGDGRQRPAQDGAEAFAGGPCAAFVPRRAPRSSWRTDASASRPWSTPAKWSAQRPARVHRLVRRGGCTGLRGCNPALEALFGPAVHAEAKRVLGPGGVGKRKIVHFAHPVQRVRLPPSQSRGCRPGVQTVRLVRSFSLLGRSRART